MFKPADNEIKFLYNSKKISDKETYAYIQSLHEHEINELDVSKNDLTPTQLSELADTMGVRIIDLFDKSSAYFKENIEGKDLEENDLLNILVREKSALETPIMISKEGAKVVKSSSDIINMDMIFTKKEPQDEHKNETTNDRTNE
jgi:arsenate reductase-like glutaredoxin family protein